MSQATCRTRDRKIPSILTNNFLRYLFAPPERLVKRYVGRGERVADLGCGAGFHSLAMARLVGEAGRVHAVDFDPFAIARLQRRASRSGFEHVIEARTMSVSEIDYIENRSISFVLAEGLLCCMADHSGAIRQIRRILRPAGRAYLSVIKISRPDDPRGVSREEWERILGSFRVLDNGQSFLTRWALVSPHDGEQSAEPSPEDERTTRHLPCC
ncbi:MAG TPA: methyltransferase domain-containing protein [Spirochaetia bacterium]|nr:methyltransferase domain-containing protein [Spirochaetia bacterium]